MAILPILKYPNKILKTVCIAVTQIDKNTSLLIQNMIETMYSHQGCVGLAAPQVGCNLRIIVIDASGHKKTTLHHNLLLLINPVIIKKEGAVVIREGCLSLPDYTGNVRRATKVIVQGFDRNYSPTEIYAEGFEAIVLQHEIDHLDGYLFIDRVSSIKRDVFRRKAYQ